MKKQAEEAEASKEMIQGFRLSPQQKRTWLLQQSERALPERASCAVLIEGAVNNAALRAALDKVVGQHEILRTDFQSLPGMKMALQVVSRSSIKWETAIDLSGLDEQQQAARIEALLQEHVQASPLHQEALRLCCVSLSQERQVLVISLPALCADAQTLQYLVNEIGRCYASSLINETLQDEQDEAVPYAVVSEWLNELLGSDEAEAGKDYWRAQNISESPALRLPFEARASGALGFEPRLFSLSVHPERVAVIESLCEKYGATPYALLLACWNVLLFRLGGQSDIVVGAAFDGRADEELKGLLGPLTKYLPVHSQLHGDVKFREILEQAQASVDEATKWQECFTWEQNGTPAGSDAHLNFFPIAFDYQRWAATFRADEVSFSLQKQFTCPERFKLKLCCLQTETSLTTEFHYDSSLFSPADIESLAGQFDKLLESISRNPEAPINEFEILTDEEKLRILFEFNQTATSYPLESPAHRLFEQQVVLTPDSVALVFDSQSLTYQQLNERANQLARQLIELGVRPESLVAILMKRSTEMVVSLLAVLKAGAAYLPLDSSYPAQRLSFMLEDAQPVVLLRPAAMKSSLLDVPQGMAVVELDEQKSAATPDVAEYETTNPEVAVSPDNLAYVIYTSGSTGQPKGVMITHRGLSNYLRWSSRAYGLSASQGTPLHSSLSFDSSITALFNPLITGGWVHLLAEERGVELLSQALLGGSQLYSLVKITPAHLTALRQTARGSAAEVEAGTHCFVVGGEALSWDEVQHWRERGARGRRLINEYGPTETVVGCCVYEVGEQAEDEASENAGVPIGRPIANMQMYVLDERLMPVPVGVSGELYIGGVGLARGYCGRAELTAERFIPHPYSTEPGERLYRTGDIGKYRADGALEYVGRVDYQVKVRGYRIELGEIEAVLRQHEGVREAVVLARQSASGEKQLVAYLVGEGESASTLNQLKAHLRERLPEYMMPTAFVRLDALPLNSGKVDRKALPAPEQVSLQTARPFVAPFVAPRTPFEEELAVIWQNLLRVERVGVHDNFFELGGHSLIATQLALRVQETFHVSLTLQTIFDGPTISEMTAAITAKLSEEEGQAELNQMLEDLKQLSPDEIKVLLEAEG
jgi:amino acid adenylation domain-containing protein